MSGSRKPYPSEVSDEEWVLVALYLALLPKSVGALELSVSSDLQRAALSEDGRAAAVDAQRSTGDGGVYQQA